MVIKARESSQLAAKLCLTTDGEESLLHGTSKVKLSRYHGVAVDEPLLH
jgi:hypothetical protein